MWVGVGMFEHIQGRLGKGGQVWMGQTDGMGMGGFGCACSSRGVCGWLWKILGRYR